MSYLNRLISTNSVSNYTFSYFRNPTPDSYDDILEGLKWLPLIPNKSMRGLNMGTTLKMIKLPEEKRMEFWDQLRHEFFPNTEKSDEL